LRFEQRCEAAASAANVEKILAVEVSRCLEEGAGFDRKGVAAPGTVEPGVVASCPKVRDLISKR